jgi:hypothetical protein
MLSHTPQVDVARSFPCYIFLRTATSFWHVSDHARVLSLLPILLVSDSAADQGFQFSGFYQLWHTLVFGPYSDPSIKESADAASLVAIKIRLFRVTKPKVHMTYHQMSR